MINSRNNLNNITCLGIFILTIFLSLNVILYGVTDKNYISIIEQKILALAGIYTEEIKSVEIASDGWSSNEDGSWHITKSAEWIITTTAKVTFNVDSFIKSNDKKKDVIFVLDISGSMNGNKLDRVKFDSTELVDYILSDTENQVALITFDTTSTIVSKFTNEKDTFLNYIDKLSASGNINYNAGLKNVLSLLNGYEKQDDRILVILFLTDGYPNEDCPNQVATYEKIKDKYSFASINGVQYEMGTDIIQDIIDITDNQYYADMTILNNVLFEASLDSYLFEKFEVIDYVDNDNFYVNSVDDIEVSIETVTLEEENGTQKITWNLGDSFKTDGMADMTIDLTLKEQYANQEGYYATNVKEAITSVIQGDDGKFVDSTLTPVLHNKFKVIYDANEPNGCSLTDVEETHFIYEVVNKKDNSLTFDNYIFKGWEIVDSDVKKINDDYFIMPDHDVTIKALWFSLDISKSMEGTVNEKITLYKVIQNEAESDSGYAYTLILSDGSLLSDVNYNITFGTEYVDNGDGTYELTGTITTIERADWFSNYSTYKGQYMYSDSKHSGLYYLNSTDYYYYYYYYYYYSFTYVGDGYKYGNDVEYDASTGTYELVDTEDSSIMQFW